MGRGSQRSNAGLFPERDGGAEVKSTVFRGNGAFSGVPIFIRDFPIPVRDFPTHVRDFPTGVRDFPTDVRGVPAGVRDFPAGVRGVPAWNEMFPG